jgi:hypothetical protein
MHRYFLVTAALFALAPAVLPTVPALAISAKQRMETCKFGADDQKLAGKQRTEFIKKCMANRNDPRGPAVGTPAAAGAEAAPGEEPAPKD